MKRKIDYTEFNIDIFQAIGKQSFLLASGTINHHNCMTVGWAGLGYLWRRPMAFVYVRPQRYTFQLMAQYNYFSMNFFSDNYNNILQLCGTKSGRDIDKMHLPGITPEDYQQQTIYYKEAQIVLICKKIYYQDLNPENLVEKSVLSLYPLNDFHRIYYGEVTSILTER